METMDLIPSYIVIFDKYDNCKRFTQNSCGKSKTEIYGYYAISYLCFAAAIKQHNTIEKNLDGKITAFY
jgi:hypothetical protein